MQYQLSTVYRADTIGRLSAFAENQRQYHNLKLSVSTDRKKIPIGLPLSTVITGYFGLTLLPPSPRMHFNTAIIGYRDCCRTAKVSQWPICHNIRTAQYQISTAFGNNLGGDIKQGWGVSALQYRRYRPIQQFWVTISYLRYFAKYSNVSVSADTPIGNR